MTDERNEITLHGIAASPGIVYGRAYVFTKHTPRIEERAVTADEAEQEIARMEGAVERSEKELQKILRFTEEKVGSQKAKIFEAQIMILMDTVLFDAVRRRIRKELKSAESIVHKEISKYQQMMLKSPDEYMRERAHDVEDVKNRLIRNIQQDRLISRFDSKSIVISELLTPADTVLFSRNDVLAYATDMGGTTSHAALLSRSLKIPSVVGLKEVTKHVQQGDWVLVDGYAGTVVVHPTRETVSRLNKKKREHRQFEERLVQIRDLSAQTTDGKDVRLSGNIEFSQEFRYLSQQGAHGIGLYRTEGIFLRSDGYPSEQAQYQEYKTIVEKAKPYKVVMRTLDIGGDKVVAETHEEENPFLGWRGIRISLDKPEVFRTQLRAMLRASAHGDVGIMLPMISGIKEIRRAKEHIAAAKEELRAEGTPFDETVKLGVMIEVPAAAVLAGDIAQEVDFLSIGTNDLIQYLIAVDRGNETVSSLYQEFHPAVIKTIHHIIKEGHRHGRPVSMCGEMAGDPVATLLLLGLGLDEFSVAPVVLPEIKKIIRSVSYRETEEIARHVLEMKTEEDIKDFLRVNLHSMVPELLLE
ncbi:MAG: phosphoenolpyruvate--protein phosphotransferase [Bacteroidetes bacterium]|nr:MAG: phosphoenolpyruvate--protein phosphotransferase [Bacteroidota bacterium]